MGALSIVEEEFTTEPPRAQRPAKENRGFLCFSTGASRGSVRRAPRISDTEKMVETVIEMIHASVD